ncbi:MAG: radical SAM protein [Peptostreptococcales bacterium]
MIKNAKQKITAVMLNEAVKYLEKDPIRDFPKLLNWAEKIITNDRHKMQAKYVSDVMKDEGSVGCQFITRILTELDSNCRKKFLFNMIMNSGIIGMPMAQEASKKYGCNVPWTLIIDPTAACNLKCTGCWAAEYSKSDSLTYDVIDRVIQEGKEIGMYMYIFSGGEPLVRREDILKLCEKHNDCMFLAFTNGTFIDDKFAQECQRVGNITFAISVEGFEAETDFRRGKGTYKKVMIAMDNLKKYGVGFGFSTCYHSKNTEVVGSDEYLELMLEKGCYFGWYFTYMPLGKDADLDLLATPEQREYMYYQVRESRKKYPMFVLDFWNDGEYVNGCIAGGRRYFHINANGDVEPCAFIHYANTNIKDVSLIEALQSPLFKQYQQNQPFNENMLRPCPLLDNPEQLKKMVLESKAESTQPMDQERVEDLTDKCQEPAAKWAVVADELWGSQNINKKASGI